jgi:guanylate kinase
VTGPSGVGKGTLIRALRERMPGLRLSVSATTRPPRPGEEHGSDYWFLDEEEFDDRLRRGEFLEHATYAGNRYGTLRSEIDRAPRAGSDGGEAVADGPSGLVLEIELQGARQVRDALPEAVQVFVRPPSLDALRARLVGRGAESPEQVESRLRVAADEMAAADAGEFDHVVVNDRLEDAAQELVDLVATIWGPRAKDSPE